MSSNTNVSTEVSSVKRFGQVLRSSELQARIRSALPKNVSIDRFTTTTQIAINHNPGLLKADQQSLFNAIVKCATDGLMPDGKDAVLNVYNTNIGTKERPQYVEKVQYQRMVGGVLKQFAEAGINAYAVSVYSKDRFRLWNDNHGQHVEHEPVTFGDRGEMVGVLAVATLPGGQSVVEAMNLEDIGRAREASKTKNSGPWVTWFDRMAQKSVLHRLRARVAIVSPDASDKLSRIDDEFSEDEFVDTDTGEIVNPKQEKQRNDEKRTSSRPKSLQNIVDEEAPPMTDDPGPGDVV